MSLWQILLEFYSFLFNPTHGVTLILTFSVRGKPAMGPLSFEYDSTVTATVTPVDRNGKTVAFPAPPVWTVTGPQGLVSTPSADGSSDVITGGSVGTVGVTVTCAGLTASDTLTLTALPAVKLVTSYAGVVPAPTPTS